MDAMIQALRLIKADIHALGVKIDDDLLGITHLGKIGQQIILVEFMKKCGKHDDTFCAEMFPLAQAKESFDQR